MLVTVNNRLILEIEIVHDLSCHPVFSVEVILVDEAWTKHQSDAQAISDSGRLPLKHYAFYLLFSSATLARSISLMSLAIAATDG